MSPPRLLYHSPSLTPYPTNTASSVCCIRFSTSVRITSIRIIPEGVQTLNNNIGVTYPPKWVGQVFLNTSDSDPVNALPTCQIDVEGGEYDLDFAIDMPEDVTTRMMMLRAPIERITLSIYGYTAEDTPSPTAAPVTAKIDHEDWSWVHTWAGGISNLINLLDDDTPKTTLSRALDCLDLLVNVKPQILDQIIDQPTALPFLLSLPSYPVQPILQRVYSDPTYSLHPSLRHHLPPSHPLRVVATGDQAARRAAAWKRLDLGRGALMTLVEEPGDLLEVVQSEERSNLVRLMVLADGHADGEDIESRKSLEIILDIVDGYFPHAESVTVRYLLERLPWLFVISRTRGSTRSLPFSVNYSRQVAQSLVHLSTEVVQGVSAFPAAKHLAEPYLSSLDPSDPLVSCFSQPEIIAPSTPFPDTSDGRRLARLATAIGAAPGYQTSVQHTVSPEELLSLVAPELLRSLQSAPVPPLGIRSVLSGPTPESQASNWAGKVYSEHQFRSREAAPGIGLGINTAMGMSRPASRHVDAYARS